MINPEWDATATAAAVAAGQVSAREVAEAAIARIEELNPTLNAVVSTRYEQALAEIDAGLPQGPFTGVPFLVKDLNTHVGGLPATSGSRLFADDIKAEDDELVRRYKRAGLVVLGMTNSPEFGLNASTEPQLYGPTRNPYNVEHSPGGSSGGSAAAVAAGAVPMAHATDGGGSIRIPAAACGLVGLKISRGRTSLYPNATRAFGAPVSVSHAVTTTVRDTAALLDATAGVLPGEAYGFAHPEQSFLAATEREPGRLRIGLVTELREGPAVDPEVKAAVEAAAKLCEELGHEVTQMVPNFAVPDVAVTSAVMMGIGLVAEVDDRLEQLGRELQDDDLEPFTAVLLDMYRQLSGLDVFRAQTRAQEIGWEVGQDFTSYDVLLTPTLAQPPPRLGFLDTTDPEAIYTHAGTYSAFTSVFNVTGMPGISLPLGATSSGLPIGVQLVADLGGEPLLLSLAAQIEKAAPWKRLAP